MPSLLQQTRFALNELGIRPRTQLGQHFLIDAEVVRHMVQAAELTPDMAVLEIGPGLGVVSEALMDIGVRLYLVELDRLLAQRLAHRFGRFETVRVLTDDFLKLDVARTFAQSPVRVVASLPYQVATPILFRLLEHRDRFSQATVMLQKEVAERVAAGPGTKAYGVLSVLMQLYAEVAPICTVGPRSFFPAPKVHSQVIKLVFHAQPRVAVRDPSMFTRVVKAAFAQRRKTLRNTLRAAGFAAPEDIATQVGLDPQWRGETLGLEEFAALANAFSERNEPSPPRPPGTAGRRSARRRDPGPKNTARGGRAL